jgi:hypothetical protein
MFVADPSCFDPAPLAEIEWEEPEEVLGALGSSDAILGLSRAALEAHFFQQLEKMDSSGIQFTSGGLLGDDDRPRKIKLRKSLPGGYLRPSQRARLTAAVHFRLMPRLFDHLKPSFRW